MKVRRDEDEREVVAIVRTTDGEGDEVLDYWVRTPAGGMEPWPAPTCEVVP